MCLCLPLWLAVPLGLGALAGVTLLVMLAIPMIQMMRHGPGF